MSRLGIGFVACLGTVTVARVEYQPAEAHSIDGHGRPFPGLVLSLSADKAVFKQGEDVTVTAKLWNRSNRHIAISYKEGVFPYLISVDLQIKGGGPIFDPVSKTATGERVLNPKNRSAKRKHPKHAARGCPGAWLSDLRQLPVRPFASR